MDIDDLLESFEEYWECSDSPSLEAFLGKHSKAEIDALALDELVKVDLHRVWLTQAGHDIQFDDSLAATLPGFTENYARRFPRLQQSTGYPCDILAEELLARLCAGRSPTLEELKNRFPDVQNDTRESILYAARAYHRQHAPNVEAEAPLDFSERFVVQRLLGQGGMGRVYLALDPRLERQVALKVPHDHLKNDSLARGRFLREGRAAGAISHPNIVAVYETGNDQDSCFIASEYVPGPNLKDWFRNHQQGKNSRLDAQQAAKLVMILAQGVQAAHACGVIHRDLKPGNILLQNVDNDDSRSSRSEDRVRLGKLTYRPRITDFGLAGLSQSDSNLTMTGTALGTAAYMAPEQVKGKAVGAQADVFALGVILYELLTGRSPFAQETYVATIDQVRNHEPVSPHRMFRSVDSDLSAICECALAKETSSRYSSAQLLADDLGRYLAGQPVTARAIGPVGRTLRWSRRNPLAAVLILTVCASLIWALWQNQQLGTLLSDSERLRNEANEANVRYRDQVYAQDIRAAFDAHNSRNFPDVRQLLARHSSIEANHRRGLEWRILERLVRANPPRVFSGHTDHVRDIVVSQDRQTLISTSDDKTVRYWNIPTGQEKQDQRLKVTTEVRALAISPNGRDYWLGANWLQSRRIDTGRLATPFPVGRHKFGIRAIAISPDAKLIASNSFQSETHVNSTTLGGFYDDELGTAPLNANRIDFSHDGKWLYYLTVNKANRISLVVWDRKKREVHRTLGGESRTDFAVIDAANDGPAVAVSDGHALRILDGNSGMWTHASDRMRNCIRDIEFSPDGERVVCGLEGGSAAVFSVPKEPGNTSLIPESVLQEDSHTITSVAWLDNDRFFTADYAGNIRLHEVPKPVECVRAFTSEYPPILLDGGSWAAYADTKKELTLAAMPGGEDQRISGVKLGRVWVAEIDASHQRIAVSDSKRIYVVRLGDMRLDREIVFKFVDASPPRNFEIRDLSFSPDGKHLAIAGSADNWVQIWDLSKNQPNSEISIAIEMPPNEVVFSPDGRYLLIGTYERTYLYDFQLKSTIEISDRDHDLVAWNGNQQLIWENANRGISIYDIPSQSIVSEFDSETHRCDTSFLSNDRQTIGCATRHRCWFWHVSSGRYLGNLHIEDARQFTESKNAEGCYFLRRIMDPSSDKKIQWALMRLDVGGIAN